MWKRNGGMRSSYIYNSHAYCWGGMLRKWAYDIFYKTFFTPIKHTNFVTIRLKEDKPVLSAAACSGYEKTSTMVPWAAVDRNMEIWSSHTSIESELAGFPLRDISKYSIVWEDPLPLAWMTSPLLLLRILHLDISALSVWDIFCK